MQPLLLIYKSYFCLHSLTTQLLIIVMMLQCSNVLTLFEIRVCKTPWKWLNLFNILYQLLSILMSHYWGINLYIPIKWSKLTFFPGSVNLWIFPGCKLKILLCFAGDYQIWPWKNVQVEPFYRYKLIPHMFLWTVRFELLSGQKSTRRFIIVYSN